MSLFKKRVAVQDFWEQRLAGMFSGKNEPGWDVLKKSFQDPALEAVEAKDFYKHMQALTIEIVSIAIAKSCSIDVSFDSGAYVEKFLQDNAHTDITPLITLYSRAFGSSSTDGIKEMVSAFSQNVADSQLAPATLEGFNNTLYLLLRQIFKLLDGIKLVS